MINRKLVAMKDFNPKILTVINELLIERLGIFHIFKLIYKQTKLG